MKIETVKNILSDITKCFSDNDDYIDMCFAILINKDDFIAQIIFELIKEQYYTNLPLASLRTYVADISQNPLGSLDADYEQLKRSRIIASKVQKKLYQQIGIVIPQTNDFKSKAEGYKYNPLQIHQINNYQNLEIIKSLMKGRMLSSKKVSRSRFRDIFQEYDSYVNEQMKKAEHSPKERLACSIDFYDLQIRMKIELTYISVLYMEKYNFHDYPYMQASYFVNGFYGNSIHLQNRFLLKQHKWLLQYVFVNSQNEAEFVKVLLFKLMVLKKQIMNIFYNKISCCDFSINDMAHFVELEYNPFSIFQNNKKWSNNQIDLARKVLNPFWSKSE